METGVDSFWADAAQCLPEWLAERVRVIRDGAGPASGEFVLYWMHHAVRGHENPALDTARLLAAHLGLPVLVYQGLGGNHPFNNDRHHTFILQGARDAAAELSGLGVRHAFSLPTDPTAPSPLAGLARRAAAVVTEDFPAPPFPAWTRRLAERCGRPTLAVDTSCVVPMRLVPGEHERAFRFRDKTKKLFRQRADRPYPGLDIAPVPAGSVSLGFEPVDLDRLDIAEACSGCAIDHGVAPVAHTRGGSVAGYERWEAFKTRGIAAYHRRRNRAEIDRHELSVSRMSPYLHHGHVSPFRLVREARAMLNGSGGEGAEKYIDELWVWREISHHLAFTRTDELHSTGILPEWARRTIADHASDPRELLDAETLARGRTGDALWDAAQRSLLAHGELHNNVRMTWGKALLGWHAGAAPTLASLIDLNHRYALDGSDPNSYGGLLWCLGVFDRPFAQDEPVHGSIRTRPTADHAARMDVARYRRQVSRPSWGRPLRVAVVGGGVAGMAAARTLTDHNARVTVFDKGRGPGGRASTRRRDGVPFDHGAQYFTVRDPRFRRAVDAWAQLGVVAEWSPRLASIETPGVIDVKPSSVRRYVGVPGMNAVVAHMAETLGGESEVRFGRRVTRVRHDGEGWGVGIDGADGDESFDALIVALPSPQAAELIADASPLAADVAHVPMRPCWAAMLEFDERLPIDADGLFINVGGGALSWACRDSGKPGRPAGERWVVHASASWSIDHLELERGEAAGALCRALADAVGRRLPEPSSSDAHRWRYALGAGGQRAGAPFDRERRLVVAGDWLSGGRIEGAYLSGVAAAGRLLGDVVARSQPERVEPEGLLFQ